MKKINPKISEDLNQYMKKRVYETYISIQFYVYFDLIYKNIQTQSIINKM